ncbi:MAG: Fic family protein, partial [Phycisphaerales bacterium]|nr:Fic family protein [Phycisphaerales bacterium]
SEYYDRDRAAFYAAIQGVRDGGMDLTAWLEFFVQGLATQLGEVSERGKKAMTADLIARQHELSERQVKALGHVMEHGGLTIHDFEALCPGVNRRSLQRDLKAMLVKGLLDESGTSPTDPTKRYTLGKRARP